MKASKIEIAGKKPVYDITVADVNEYVLSNGVVSHNTGGMLSSDSVIIMGKRTNKDGKELEGFDFVMNAEKSRTIREKSKIPLTVSFESGIDKASGLLELGLFTKTVTKKGHRFMPVFTDPKTGEVTEDETLLVFKKDVTKAWFDSWVDREDSTFIQEVENYFALSTNSLLGEDEENEIDDIIAGEDE